MAKSVGRVGRRWSKRGWLLFGLLLSVTGLVAAIAATQIVAARDAENEGWVRAGLVDEIRGSGIVYLEEHEVFVVARARTFLAISAAVPHMPGDRAVFCRSSGRFEGIHHGSVFDRYGRYVDGPARRGLDRFELRIRNRDLEFRPEGVISGPPRGTQARSAEGPSCLGAGGGSIRGTP